MPEGIIAVSRDTILVGASSGDLYRSFDAGQSWDSLYVSDEFQNQYGAGEYIFFFRPSTIIFTGSGGVARSDDMGNRWTYNRTKINTSLIQPKFFDRDEGVALSQRLQSTSEQFEKTAASLSFESGNVQHSLLDTLRTLNETLEALRDVAVHLQDDPSALVWGKGNVNSRHPRCRAP